MKEETTVDFVNDDSEKNNHFIERERDWGRATEYTAA